MLSISLILYLLVTFFPLSPLCPDFFFFFFNDTATTEIYTLSLHDALPISSRSMRSLWSIGRSSRSSTAWGTSRSEEHTSELQSLRHLVCRLLLEKKKKKTKKHRTKPEQKEHDE